MVDGRRTADVILLHSGGVRFEWDAHAQAAILRLDPHGPIDLSGENAFNVIDAVDRLLARKRTLLLLVDARRSDHASVGWLVRWTSFLRHNADRIHMVFFHLPAPLHGMVAMLRKSTGARIDVATDEAGACLAAGLA